MCCITAYRISRKHFVTQKPSTDCLIHPRFITEEVDVSLVSSHGSRRIPNRSGSAFNSFARTSTCRLGSRLLTAGDTYHDGSRLVSDGVVGHSTVDSVPEHVVSRYAEENRCQSHAAEIGIAKACRTRRPG